MLKVITNNIGNVAVEKIKRKVMVKKPNGKIDSKRVKTRRYSTMTGDVILDINKHSDLAAVRFGVGNDTGSLVSNDRLLLCDDDTANWLIERGKEINSEIKSLSSMCDYLTQMNKEVQRVSQSTHISHVENGNRAMLSSLNSPATGLYTIVNVIGVTRNLNAIPLYVYVDANGRRSMLLPNTSDAVYIVPIESDTIVIDSIATVSNNMPLTKQQIDFYCETIRSEYDDSFDDFICEKCNLTAQFVGKLEYKAVRNYPVNNKTEEVSTNSDVTIESNETESAATETAVDETVEE